METQKILLRSLRAPYLLLGLLVLVGQVAVAQDDIQILYAEAQAAKARGDAGDAIEKLQAILKLNPKLAPVFHNLGILFFEQGKFREASQAFAAGLQQDPTMSGSLVPLGISYYQMGQLGKAREVLRRPLASTEKIHPRSYISDAQSLI